MGGDAVKKVATYEDVLAAPGNVIAEVVFGVLHTSPRPAFAHARAATRLGSELDGPFDRGRGGPGGWILLFEPEIHLAHDIVVPDFAGWRRARMPSLPNEPYTTLAPDWVCEILSPATRKLDLTDKLRVYAREGVSHVWHLDPPARTLVVMRLENARYSILSTHKDDDRVRAEPFDAVELELDVLWADVSS
ncbi:MAG: Uma2 family endonuclease [Polyangiaceae bacterium]